MRNVCFITFNTPQTYNHHNIQFQLFSQYGVGQRLLTFCVKTKTISRTTPPSELEEAFEEVFNKSTLRICGSLRMIFVMLVYARRAKRNGNETGWHSLNNLNGSKMKRQFCGQ